MKSGRIVYNGRVTPHPFVPWLHPQAVYIHVPYCAHHCGYCDFAVVTGQDGSIDQYLDALAAEMSTLGESRFVRTIFIGGGTPTYFDVSDLERLLRLVNRWFHFDNEYEFTIEANPNRLSSEKIALLVEHGVNRISLGAQSFHQHLLRVLERDHQPEDLTRAVELARRSVAQVSIDLIFGISGETIPEWESDLRQAIALFPEHISTYGLTYERGTRLWRQRDRGEIEGIGEERELEMYSRALDILGDAGYEQYEISNHARPGHRCRHNEVYWANHAYFGFGLGAARYLNGRRTTNTRNLRDYIRRALSGDSTAAHSEELEPEERARETLALQLRRSIGIERAPFVKQTGFELNDLVGDAIRHHVELGLLTDDGVDVRLTRQGKYVADSVIRAFI